MAGGNADMVRRACEAWCAGDISIYREMYTADVIAEGGGLWPEGDGSIRGAENVIGNFETVMAPFERSELIPIEFHEDGDALAVELRWRGYMAGIGTPVEQQLVCGYRFRDGLIAYTAWYPELATALQALGIGAAHPTAPGVQPA